MGNQDNVRRPKTDAADAQNKNEASLPGQIPVREAGSDETEFERKTEQQPDPVAAELAVNPELLSGIKPEDAGVHRREIKNAEDGDKGER
jgi:hypothetical protein